VRITVSAPKIKPVTTCGGSGQSPCEHAQDQLRAFVKRWESEQPKVAAWAEENLPEGFAELDFPPAHQQKMRTSNSCENLNSQIKRRTRVVGVFPSEDSLERLVTGVLIEISET
jgi:putative transposase